MEHKFDDFFRKKIDGAEDSLPENSAFDEHLFWGELQKKLDKPQRKSWWQWVAVAACLGGLIVGIVSVSTTKQEIPVTTDTKIIEPPKEVPNPVAVVVPEKTKVKIDKTRKKEAIQLKKELKIEVEQLAVKMNLTPVTAPIIKQDSIHFKPVMAEVKPQFRTIHVNEISNIDKAPIPQPKFKVRFAVRNQH
ncbi:hypothetical protein [Emticicia agri]|uniref:Uncharacterized protein n=1 Tax=Emticicia agri TaxID=2492393 RepID=A0A4Q5LXX1_9BACT|nr:hypothetical protein [Emticicia agri]RYU94499.1 hypothetical protein EWM59_17005 [Emticicia agri]